MRTLALMAVLAMPALVPAAEEPRYQGQPLAHWFAVLQSGQDDRDKERWEAAGVLARLTPADKTALPFLMDRLTSTDAGNRRLVLFCLRRLGPPSLDALAEQIRSDDADRRAVAAELLGELAPHSKSATPELTKLLKDGKPAVRLAASVALWRLGAKPVELVPVWVELLKTDKAGLMKPAARHLGLAGPDAKAALDPLLRLLKDDNDDLRATAAVAILRIDPERTEAIAALLSWLRHDTSDEVTTAEALDALRLLGDRAAPGLLEMVKDSKLPAERRLLAGRLLAWTPRPTPDMIAALIELLPLGGPKKGGDPVVRLGAAAVEPLVALLGDRPEEMKWPVQRALLELGSLARPALVQATRHRAAAVRAEAAELLGSQGVLTDEVEKALRRLLADENENVSMTAAEALFYLDPIHGREAERVAAKRLSSKDIYLRIRAATHLHTAPPREEDSIKALGKALGDKAEGARDLKEEVVRDLAVMALGRCGPAAKSQTAELRRALTDSNGVVRRHAALILSAVEPANTEALPVLLRLLENDSSGTAEKAIRGYGPRAIPALLDLLAEYETRNHTFVGELALFDMLADLGKEDRAVLKALNKVLASDSPRRAEAAAALARIDPTTPNVLPLLLKEQTTEGGWSNVHKALHRTGKDAWPELANFLRSPLAPKSPRHPFDVLARVRTVRLMADMAGLVTQDERPSGIRATVEQREAFPFLVAALADRIDDVRQEVRRILVSNLHGPHRDALLAALRHGLEAKDPVARLCAAEVLLAVPGEKQALDILRAGLADTDRSVRDRAWETLSRNAVVPDTLMKPLLAGLDDPEGDVRQTALRVLHALDNPDRAVLRRLLALVETDESCSGLAALVLEFLDPSGEKSGADLAKLVLHPSPAVRGEAIQILAGQKHNVDALLPVLIEFALRSSLLSLDPSTLNLAEICARYTPAALPALLDAWQGGPGQVHSFPDPLLQREVARWLGPLGPAVRKAAPLLRDALPTADPALRTQLLRALVLLDPDEPKLTPHFVAQLKHELRDIPDVLQLRMGTFVEVAPRMGQAHAPAVAALLEERTAEPLLDRDDQRLRFALPEKQVGPLRQGRGEVAAVLGCMGKEARAAAPALAAALGDDRAAVRWWSAWALLRMHEKVNEALPVFLEGLQSTPNLADRLLAYRTLARHPDHARLSVPVLLRMLRRCEVGHERTRLGRDTWDPSDELEILIALATLGPAARDAAPELRRLLHDPTALTPRRQLAFTLARVSGDSAPAVAELQAAAKTGRWDGALFAEAAGVGLKPAELTALLRPALHHPDPLVRLRAGVALVRNDTGKVEDLQPSLEALLALGRDYYLEAGLREVASLGARARPLLPTLKKARAGAILASYRQAIDEAIRTIEKR